MKISNIIFRMFLLVFYVGGTRLILPDIKIDNSIERWLPENSPETVKYKKFLEEFNTDAQLILSIENSDSSIRRNEIDQKIIFWVFRMAFSPLLYKHRGLSQQALIHQKGNDMASMFYGRFRDFFTATPPRYNYYLQFYFMGEVLFDEVLPDFLNPSGVENVRKRENCLLLETKAIQDEIFGATRLQYGNYALSNISD